MNRAIELDKLLQAHYEDRDNGVFFMTHKDQTGLIAREKPNYDGAEPSGNSIALLNLLKLGAYTTRDDYRVRAEKILTAFLGGEAARPMSLSEMLIALDFHTDQAKEIVIVTPAVKKEEAGRYLLEFRKKYLPNRILTVAAEGEEIERHAKLIPIAAKKTALMGKAAAYVCSKGVCKLPATDPALFSKQLSEVEKYPETGR